jgi:hypothetical protein
MTVALKAAALFLCLSFLTWLVINRYSISLLNTAIIISCLLAIISLMNSLSLLQLHGSGLKNFSDVKEVKLRASHLTAVPQLDKVGTICFPADTCLVVC